MTGQRNHNLPALVILITVLLPLSPWAAAPGIVLPEPFALELPPGVATLGAEDEAMRQLTATVRADGHRVTMILPRDRVGPGIWRVILAAWGTAPRDPPAARREAALYVLPHGMVPIGLSGSTNATAGNNTTHIARDASGFVHMVWGDSGRSLSEGALYRRARVLPDGSVSLDTDILDLAPHKGNWTAVPSLTSVGNTVHFTWQADGTARYRSLTREGEAWRWSDEIDTRAPSPGRDTGASIAADARGVHILTPGGVYTASGDGGRTWITETVPFGTVHRVKTASLGLDSMGRPLASASVIVKDAPHYSEQKGSGGYWTIRLARRIGAGAWETLPGPVDGRREWAASTDASEDVLSDWVRVLEDRTGGMHATWHGTAVSRIYGNDRGYYAWRPPGGDWQAPVSLREPDLSRGSGWSYAPGLTLDGDRALPLVFHSTRVGQREVGFDSELGSFRAGRRTALPLPVTRFAHASLLTGKPANALSTWFPGAASALTRTADGRVWIDVLMTLVPTGIAAPGLVVWRRMDVTEWLKGAEQ